MKDKWLKGTIFLTITALLTKILSMLYKIPYQNIVGDEGLYAFQQVYPLLGIYTVLGTVVLPSIISEVLLTNQYNEVAKTQLKRTLWLFSALIFAVLFLGSGLIARAMGDASLSAAIRWVGLVYLLLPHLAYLRGVHLTRPETMARVGISITIEQLVRVIMILVAIAHFNYGTIFRTAEMAYLLGLAGPVMGILYLGMFKLEDEPKQYIKKKIPLSFFKKTAFLFLGAGILTIFQLIDSFTVYISLLRTGMDPMEAMVQKGIFDRGFPIIQSATFFIGALVSSTLPQMVSATDDKQRKNVFNHAMFYVTVLSIPATVGLYMVMPYLNTALFEDTLGTGALRILSLQVLFFPFMVLTSAVLQQEERYSEMAVAVLAGIFIKLMATPLLTEAFGIYGTALSSVIALGAMALVNLILFRKMMVKQTLFNTFKVGFATLSMWLALEFIMPALHDVLGNNHERTFSIFMVTLSALGGGLVYGLIMLLFILTTKTATKPSKTKKRPKPATQSIKRTKPAPQRTSSQVKSAKKRQPSKVKASKSKKAKAQATRTRKRKPVVR